MTYQAILSSSSNFLLEIPILFSKVHLKFVQKSSNNQTLLIQTSCDSYFSILKIGTRVRDIRIILLDIHFNISAHCYKTCLHKWIFNFFFHQSTEAQCQALRRFLSQRSSEGLKIPDIYRSFCLNQQETLKPHSFGNQEHRESAIEGNWMFI